MLSCSTVHVAALFLYWFIEQINDDDADDESSDGEVAVGMWFQIWGAAEEKARRPNGFCHGNVQERLTRGTERTTGLMV